MATFSKISKVKTVSLHDEDSLITSQEESVIRLLRGINAPGDQVLEKKTNDRELLARLLELERAIINKAKEKFSNKG